MVVKKNFILLCIPLSVPYYMGREKTFKKAVTCRLEEIEKSWSFLSQFQLFLKFNKFSRFLNNAAMCCLSHIFATSWQLSFDPKKQTRNNNETREFITQHRSICFYDSPSSSSDFLMNMGARVGKRKLQIIKLYLCYLFDYLWDFLSCVYLNFHRMFSLPCYAHSITKCLKRIMINEPQEPKHNSRRMPFACVLPIRWEWIFLDSKDEQIE